MGCVPISSHSVQYPVAAILLDTVLEKRSQITGLASDNRTSFRMSSAGKCYVQKKKIRTQLLDAETNILYTTFLSPEDAKRIAIDIHFAQSVLNGLIRDQQPNEPIQKSVDETVEEPETQNFSNNAESEDIHDATWTHEKILLLISTYREQQEKMKSGKVLLRKMWKQVSEDMKKMGYDIPSNKCANKMDALKRRYRKIIDHNKQSGNDLMTFKYFDELKAIFRKQPWVDPVAVASNELQDSSFENGDERDGNRENVSPNTDEKVVKKSRTKVLHEILEEKRLYRKSSEEYQKRKLSLLQKLVDHIMEKK
ncbi:uncharacterized protein [Linepithema humile]|uniref:uncharacterized protein n=1 Tax=Linepithema humile TaxID=83485 RepID=UPI00351E136C